MYYYRVSKYNPKYRDDKGRYLKNEWTSIDDIGKKYEDGTLTSESYLKTENMYINAALYAIKETNLKEMYFIDFEKVGKLSILDKSEIVLESLYRSLRENMIITTNDICQIIKLILREIIWGKLISRELSIHFGYDYYMYFISEQPLNDSLNYTKEQGLFIENIRSPYWEEEE